MIPTDLQRWIDHDPEIVRLKAALDVHIRERDRKWRATSTQTIERLQRERDAIWKELVVELRKVIRYQTMIAARRRRLVTPNPLPKWLRNPSDRAFRVPHIRKKLDRIVQCEIEVRVEQKRICLEGKPDDEERRLTKLLISRLNELRREHRKLSNAMLSVQSSDTPSVTLAGE